MGFPREYERNADIYRLAKEEKVSIKRLSERYSLTPCRIRQIIRSIEKQIEHFEISGMLPEERNLEAIPDFFDRMTVAYYHLCGTHTTEYLNVLFRRTYDYGREHKLSLSNSPFSWIQWIKRTTYSELLNINFVGDAKAKILLSIKQDILKKGPNWEMTLFKNVKTF